MTPGNYILGRAKQRGLSVTQLAGLLHMTYPTLHQRLAGRSIRIPRSALTDYLNSAG